MPKINETHKIHPQMFVWLRPLYLQYSWWYSHTLISSPPPSNLSYTIRHPSKQSLCLIFFFRQSELELPLIYSWAETLSRVSGDGKKFRDQLFEWPSLGKSLIFHFNAKISDDLFSHRPCFWCLLPVSTVWNPIYNIIIWLFSWRKPLF